MTRAKKWHVAGRGETEPTTRSPAHHVTVAWNYGILPSKRESRAFRFSGRGMKPMPPPDVADAPRIDSSYGLPDRCH